MHTIIRTVMLTSLMTAASSLAAQPADGDVFSMVAEDTGVPVELLEAVARAASGRQVGDGGVVPWPWTLRVAGTLHHYRSRTDAEAELVRLQALGITHVDIGLMQVNWRRHHERAPSPSALLDPQRNVTVAASILRSAWRFEGDLWSATADISGQGAQAPDAYRMLVSAQLLRLLSERQVDQRAPSLPSRAGIRGG
jgi:hypothetical protein